jgi:hypothetical protein
MTSLLAVVFLPHRDLPTSQLLPFFMPPSTQSLPTLSRFLSSPSPARNPRAFGIFKVLDSSSFLSSTATWCIAQTSSPPSFASLHECNDVWFRDPPPNFCFFCGHALGPPSAFSAPASAPSPSTSSRLPTSASLAFLPGRGQLRNSLKGHEET